MEKIKTSCYEITFKEVSKKGPGGYESTYLTSEGFPAPDKLYKELKKLQGSVLPIENKTIRHRNGATLTGALENKKSLGIASGFKPSGPYHFGHKLTSSIVSFFQKNGVQIFMPIADVECEMDSRTLKKQYLYWAADNLLDWGANGVNLDASHVYLQSEERRVNDLTYRVARELKFGLTVDTYGLEKMIKDFPFLFAGIAQVADILLPQHQDFRNYHSFMVSGQDQDGHMKMAVALTKKAIKNKENLYGIQTIPSAFYIPHIRGLIGKASSSKEKSTLYLGPGRKGLDLEGRTKDAKDKIDTARKIKNPETERRLRLFALDMVRYIPSFNNQSRVDFSELVSNLPVDIKRDILAAEDDAKKSAIMDNYLLKECKYAKQDNLGLIMDLMKDTLKEHQMRRERVLKYAVERMEYKDPGAWSLDDEMPAAPDFWKIPKKAIVDFSKRNPTHWFHIVAAMKDKLMA